MSDHLERLAEYLETPTARYAMFMGDRTGERKLNGISMGTDSSWLGSFLFIKAQLWFGAGNQA